ncbi:2-C-methyl-D-erythritol 4-phosphate cytidylyltransferase [Kingella kingae]|uniref:2-C-methyl-D-erythritol 4-phosphate cytidylyltransferase n=1 Tax=Kingella kingae TaxID=504 RepID=UPI0004231FEA|nr:2-C-methyl-D-erythritol 4-phosphate cytidylyltransferase [Kingella kingae]
MKYPVLIPAAGVGSRFGASIPKQYAQIAHAPVLQHTIDLFTQNPRIGQIAVIISPEDEWYDNCIKQPAQCNVYRVGGSSRTKSVANGLATLLQQQKISPNDTILVHDAARCCLPQAALNRLLDALPQCPYGAILAIPVADTLKSQDDNQRIVHTVPRAAFVGKRKRRETLVASSLHRALQTADLEHITDEASAMERLGFAPQLVEGDNRNLKLTRPDDAAWAAFLLQQAQLLA